MKTFHIACGIMLVALGCTQALYFDANGTSHGTGERDYNYKSGAIKLRENYKDGKIVLSRWFAPDGDLIQQSVWSDGTGEGIYLREDGSIRMRMQYVNGIAEGEALAYDEAGHATKMMYRAGKLVGEGP